MVDELRRRLVRLRKLDLHLGGADTYNLYAAEAQISKKLLRDGVSKTSARRELLALHSGCSGAVELVEVALEQLVDGRVRPRVPPLVDLTHQSIPGGVSLLLGLRSRRDDLDEVVPTLRHRVDTGVYADAECTAGQLVDAPSLAP